MHGAALVVAGRLLAGWLSKRSRIGA